MKSLVRKPLFIAWAVLGALLVFTLINLNLLMPRTSLWQSNWLLVVLAPIFIILPLALAAKNPKEKNSRSRLIAITLKVVAWILAVPVFLFLLVASGTKYAQLEIQKTAKNDIPRTTTSDIDFQDVRGEIHVHSSLSWDSQGKIEDIVAAAKKNGVRWIIFTDHLGHLPPGNYLDTLDGVTLIYGQERQHRIGGKQCGSALRASLKDPERGLQLYGHIEKYGDGRIGPYDRWDGIELVSFHANARSRLGSLFGRLIFNPREFYPTLTYPTTENLEQWLWRAKTENRPIPIFAAPDAHQNMGILGCQTDPYEFIFKMVSTHIWIEKDEGLNQESIFKAIKDGRTYIAFDYLGNPTGFQFYAVAPGEKFYTGDTVSQPLCLMAKVPPGECKIKFFCDNQQITEGPLFSEGRDWVINPNPGFWRIEVWRDNKPWILSGQILVE